MTLQEIIDTLHSLANPAKVQLKEQKFGIIAPNSLGVYQKDLQVIAQQVKKNNDLAMALFDTEIYEARILCSKIFQPKEITEALMEKWVASFENWEICDSFCMGLFSKSPFAIQKIEEWTKREKEFEKRAGFTIIASYCMADKKADNQVFESFFEIIKREATDERIYVKKAVNWALRNIGKRNIDLNKKAILLANELLKMDNKTAQWIAKDALKELQGKKINVLDYPRAIYR